MKIANITLRLEESLDAALSEISKATGQERAALLRALIVAMNDSFKAHGTVQLPFRLSPPVDNGSRETRWECFKMQGARVIAEVYETLAARAAAQRHITEVMAIMISGVEGREDHQLMTEHLRLTHTPEAEKTGWYEDEAHSVRFLWRTILDLIETAEVRCRRGRPKTTVEEMGLVDAHVDDDSVIPVSSKSIGPALKHHLSEPVKSSAALTEGSETWAAGPSDLKHAALVSENFAKHMCSDADQLDNQAMEEEFKDNTRRADRLREKADEKRKESQKLEHHAELLRALADRPQD